jgi:DNA (cytosine-5)-methyltransferase 1
MTLSLYDEFAGWGGSSVGATAVPGVELILAANHNPLDAVEVHTKNFPRADHHCGDIVKADLTRFPRADLFWGSPACPAWTNARGKRRDFDNSLQGVLFDDELGVTSDPAAVRSRALMEEIPRYLAAMAGKGQPVWSRTSWSAASGISGTGGSARSAGTATRSG